MLNYNRVMCCPSQLALTVALSCYAAMPSFVYAQSPAGEGCASYPYTSGAIPELTPGGLRIISTASVPVHFDDIGAVRDARLEATAEAKSFIVEFMVERLKSETEIQRSVSQSVTLQGADKVVARQEATKTLRRIQASSQHLLRGVVTLGECYTKGSEFRVTVGIKPETIAGASELSGTMIDPQPPNSQPPNPASGSSSGSQRGVGSYVDTEKLRKF